MIISFFETLLLDKSFCYPLFILLGLCLGSFYNVYSLRYSKIIDSNNAKDIKNWLLEKNINIPEEINKHDNDVSISFPASHCFSCKSPLKWYHNIPLISYIILGGKCAFCKSNISFQYPVVELFGGMVSFLTYVHFIDSGIQIFCVAYIFFMLSYLLLLIDLKTLYLPDELNYTLLWSALISLALFGVSLTGISLANAVIGAATGYFTLWLISTIGRKIKGYEVMGGGDLKLLAAVGAIIGTKGAIFTLFFSPFLGIITYIVSKIFKNYGKEIPFGPSIIVASWIYVYYGEEIIKLIL